MEVLDKKLEDILSNLLSIGMTDNIIVTHQICERYEIAALADKGYVKITSSKSNTFPIVVSLTQDAVNYFENKKALIAEKKKSKVLWLVSFLTPNIIALGALIVAIIALCK